ncbi:membrane protein [Pasteurella multocida]|nr:membrane protein [Pasteurella multocida]
MLIVVLIYQIQASISAFTLYLLTTLIILTIYAAFIRTPVLLLKEKGFFFGNIYFQYADIHQVNLAENNILVIDMKNGKRLLVHLLTDQDREQVIQFFGGYK